MDLALFDFDGTLTTCETFPRFMRFAATPWRLALGSVRFAPMLAGYRAGRVSGSCIRAAVTSFAFRGRPADAVTRAGRRFAAEILPGLERPEAMQRLRWHQHRGDRVIVVSGAYDLYLSPWCAIHEVELLCSSLEVRDGRLTGRYQGAQCVGEEKVRRVRGICLPDAFAACHAYGDTDEDRAMLALASHRWFRGQPMQAAATAAG